MHRAVFLTATIIALLAALLVSGCGGGSVGGGGGGGGGGPAPSQDDKSVLQGTVYTSGPIPAAAGQAPGARALYDATLQVRRMDNNAYVDDTMTDSSGRYHFPALDRGLDALLVVTSRGGEVLMSRALLDAPTVTADVDEDTTLVTRCQLLMRANGGGQTSADVEATVWQLCMQFQQANRYQYGTLGGERPDFTNQDAQWRAAAALLAAATDAAVAQARGSGNAQCCEQAVNMVLARLQAEGLVDFTLDAGLRAQIAQALRSGARYSADDIAQALTVALSRSVTIDSVSSVRGRLNWGCVQGRTGALDIVEATAAVCASGGGEQNRLESAAQVSAFVAALVD